MKALFEVLKNHCAAFELLFETHFATNMPRAAWILARRKRKFFVLIEKHFLHFAM